jgi:ABC-type sulfate transport system substrate-binding protein
MASSAKRRATRPKAKQPRPQPVTVDQVHPLAMAEARCIAQGDRARLVAFDARTVGVVNNAGQPWPGRYRPGRI